MILTFLSPYVSFPIYLIVNIERTSPASGPLQGCILPNSPFRRFLYFPIFWFFYNKQHKTSQSKSIEDIYSVYLSS